MGHNYIGTEHLLLGLVREGEGVAAQVLVSLGADLSRVRQEVIRLLSGHPEREPRAGVSTRSAATSASDRAGTAAVVVCSFCGRGSPESGRLVSGRLVSGTDAFICEHCIHEWHGRLGQVGRLSQVGDRGIRVRAVPGDIELPEAGTPPADVGQAEADIRAALPRAVPRATTGPRCPRSRRATRSDLSWWLPRNGIGVQPPRVPTWSSPSGRWRSPTPAMPGCRTPSRWTGGCCSRPAAVTPWWWTASGRWPAPRSVISWLSPGYRARPMTGEGRGRVTGRGRRRPGRHRRPAGPR